MELDGVGLIHELVDGFIDLLGSGDAGVSKGVVENVFTAHDLGLLQAIGEQLADY